MVVNTVSAAAVVGANHHPANANSTSNVPKKRQSIDNSMIRFPKLDECHHFHYPDTAELDNFHVSLINNESYTNRLINQQTNPNSNGDRYLMTDIHNFHLFVRVECGQRSWTVRRDLRDFCFLDTQLHKCVFDREHSKLKKLEINIFSSLDTLQSMCFIDDYLERLSKVVDSSLTCGPILHWFEMDNHGNRLINEESDINTPAIGAAFVIKKHCKQDVETEISLEIGELISVIEMPPLNESFYWKGKKGFEVGFFPAECVKLIDYKTSRISEELSLLPLKKCVSPTICHRPFDFNTSFSDGEYDNHMDTSAEAALRKRNKISALFSNFLAGIRTRRRDQLKRSGILKERVFGCDLCEHLENSGHEYPLVLTACCSYIEAHGLNTNGIYRISGVVSTINRLRAIFDEDRIPNELLDENIVDSTEPLDIHAVGSLLKLYFRELPNPLLTYSLFDSFISTMRDETLKEEERVQSIRRLVRRLPPPHWRTIRFLIKHLNLVSQYHTNTGMTTKNIAIVWAPNLLRTKTLDLGKDALQIVATQAVLTEFLINNYNKIFDREEYELQPSRSLYSSFVHTKEYSHNNKSPPLSSKCLKYIDVGPEIVPGKFHTIISCRPSQQQSKRSKFNLQNFKLQNLFHTVARGSTNGAMGTGAVGGAAARAHHHCSSFRSYNANDNNNSNDDDATRNHKKDFKNQSQTSNIKYTSSFQARKILCCSQNDNNRNEDDVSIISGKQVKRSQSFDSYFKKRKTCEHDRRQKQQQQPNEDNNNNGNGCIIDEDVIDGEDDVSRKQLKNETNVVYEHRQQQQTPSMMSNHHIITNETIYEDEENKENQQRSQVPSVNHHSYGQYGLNDSVLVPTITNNCENVDMKSDSEDVNDAFSLNDKLIDDKKVHHITYRDISTKSPLPPTSIFDNFFVPAKLTRNESDGNESSTDECSSTPSSSSPVDQNNEIKPMNVDQEINEKNDSRNDAQYIPDREKIDKIKEERRKRFQKRYQQFSLDNENNNNNNKQTLVTLRPTRRSAAFGQRASMDLSLSNKTHNYNNNFVEARYSTSTNDNNNYRRDRAKLGYSMPTIDFTYTPNNANETDCQKQNNKCNAIKSTAEQTSPNITKMTITPLRTVNKRQKIIYDKTDLNNFLNNKDQI